MPVFIALYQTLNQIQHFIPSDSAMYADICSPDKTCKTVSLDFFGMNLTESAASAPKGFWNALPYFVLVGLVVVTAFLQQRQTMRNQTSPNPQMQIIGKVMPVIFGFISINIPAGVVLYFFTSNLWQIGQQEVVYRTIGTAAGPPKKKGAIEAKSTETTGKGAKAPPAEGGRGVKGLFRSLAPGAGAAGSGEPEAPSENGTPAAPDAPAKGGRGQGAAKSQGGAKSTGAKKPGTGGGAKPSGSGASKSGSRSAGNQNRRRNNRKRKR
jgi:YidC/Oxa1 family membrane protein insertase